MGIIKPLDPAEEIEKLVHRLNMHHPYNYLPTEEWWLDLANLFEARAMEIRRKLEEVKATPKTDWDQYNRTWYVLRDTDVDLDPDSFRKPGRIWACDPYRWSGDIDKDTIEYGYYELLGTVEVFGVDSYNMSEWDRISDAVMVAFLEGETIIHMESSPVSAESEQRVKAILERIPDQPEAEEIVRRNREERLAKEQAAREKYDRRTVNRIMDELEDMWEKREDKPDTAEGCDKVLAGFLEIRAKINKCIRQVRKEKKC
jgi:hypothetical protein